MKKFWTIGFFQNNLVFEFCFQESGVLEEPDAFERHWQIRRQKLLPEVGLFLGRDPWGRGKRLDMCRNLGPGTKNDLYHLVL